MSQFEKLEQVTDRDTFLVFVKALIENWEADNAEFLRKKELNTYSPVWDDSKWKNGSIGQFLKASTRWAEDTGENGFPKIPSWNTFARFLLAGKEYE